MSEQEKRPAAGGKVIENKKETDGSANKPLSRRDVLRGVTVGGVILSVDKWSRPVIESITIPAHAAGSIGLAGGDSEQVILPEAAGP